MTSFLLAFHEYKQGFINHHHDLQNKKSLKAQRAIYNKYTRKKDTSSLNVVEMDREYCLVTGTSATDVRHVNKRRHMKTINTRHSIPSS